MARKDDSSFWSGLRPARMKTKALGVLASCFGQSEPVRACQSENRFRPALSSRNHVPKRSNPLSRVLAFGNSCAMLAACWFAMTLQSLGRVSAPSKAKPKNSKNFNTMVDTENVPRAAIVFARHLSEDPCQDIQHVVALVRERYCVALHVSLR